MPDEAYIGTPMALENVTYDTPIQHRPRTTYPAKGKRSIILVLLTTFLQPSSIENASQMTTINRVSLSQEKKHAWTVAQLNPSPTITMIIDDDG